MLKHGSRKDSFTKHCCNNRLDGIWGALWNNLTNSFQLKNIFTFNIYTMELMPLEKTNTSYKT